MRKIFVLFMLTTWSATYADLAPVTSPGVTLTMTTNNSIRMKSEAVDIFYHGRYCQVNAVFVMANQTGEAMALDIGFPVIYSRMPEDRRKDIWKEQGNLYDFQVRAGGRPVTRIVARKVTDHIANRVDKEWLWFAWKQNFQPGETLVEVEYNMAPNLSHGSCFKNINYILSSGALWRGHIGEARISVRFPKAVTQEQVTSATSPAGFVIEGDTVTWKLRDFEPQEKDNLRLEFIPFRIYDKMQALRTQIKKDPQAIKLKLELARLYFTMAWEKGGGSWLPRDYDEKRFNQEVLQKIAGNADRAYFLSSYEKDGKTGLYRPNFEYTENNELRLEHLVEILSANGYEGDDDPFSARFKPFMREAEALLKETIALEPRNAAAWNTYLFYYYQLHYAGFKPDRICHYGSFIPEGQRELIRRGFAACPDDPGIRLWMELIDDSLKPVPEDIGELEYLSGSPAWRSPMIFGYEIGFPIDDELVKRIGIYYDQRPIEFYFMIKRSGKGHTTATEVDLRKVGSFSFLIKILTLFYGHKRFTYELILKKTTLSPEQKKEIVKILSCSGFFSFLYSPKIWELAVKNGLAIDLFKTQQEILNSY